MTYVCSIDNVGDVVQRRLSSMRYENIFSISVGWQRTGEGKCNRLAAILSAGASKATTGAPKVAPTSAARDPPREWPDPMSSAAQYRRYVA